ncbi:glycosyltransferase [Marivivens marinus]|uniref:glycosyltransferase n=1 Tax=Marivivens marinus TaxID=3110173 RepID=UPI003B847EEF
MLHLLTTIGDRKDATKGPQPRTALGRAVLRQGVSSARKIADAERDAVRRDARLADAFRLGLYIPAATIAAAEAEVAGAGVIDPVETPPDPRLPRQLSPEICQAARVLPWRRIGGQAVLLTSQPDLLDRYGDLLQQTFGTFRFAVTTDEGLDAALERLASGLLINRAEALVPSPESCRTWNPGRATLWTVSVLAACVAFWLVAPGVAVAALYGWAILTLVLHMGLKLAALAVMRRDRRDEASAAAEPLRLPIVTVLVPLFKEEDIAGHLVARLAKLDYPRELLDICLLLEEDDQTTRSVLRETNLPRWMRSIVVPPGTLKTKPRALNYGLGFARGSIIGVYDAEDAPAPDQIRRVVARFAQRDRSVACLQGVLDFYNAGTNWLSRCFALEYATWFRIVLPGLERLGLVIPLGGTTLFFRRDVLEELGGWDAHNVTEDADLGIRLARHGYRTELIQTVTGEEANCRAWPWVKQRSRWLKGYAVTYAVHMRSPRQLWRDLGAWRFFGVQLLFLGTLTQFALAPVLWSFWLLPLGFGHPLLGLIPGWAFVVLGSVFLMAEVLNIATAATAVTRADKPWLIKWAPTLHFYFPLAALAAWKGLGELLWKPFYWDKTSHGIFPGKAP